MPKQLKLIHLVILLILPVFALSTRSYANQRDGLLKVYFFDIGQGDAIFVESPSGIQVLIDGGPGNKVIEELGDVMPFWDKSIDLIVMTHPDGDHASGLVEVLGRFDVEQVMYSDIITDSAVYDAFKNAVTHENAQEIDAVLGTTIDLGDGVVLTVLSPLISLAGEETKKTNDNSVVLMLEYGELEVLLTGDIELKGERRMLVEGVDVDADVLKVAHHGSKTSTMKEFLSAVSPEVAIIQVGAKNRYGHPSESVLERLEDYGINIYRNDVNSTIKLISDSENYQIITAE